MSLFDIVPANGPSQQNGSLQSVLQGPAAPPASQPTSAGSLITLKLTPAEEQLAERLIRTFFPGAQSSQMNTDGGGF